MQTLTLTPEHKLYEMLAGSWVAQAIYAVTKLGIPDLLKNGSKSSEELAKEVNVKSHNLYRLLRVLSGLAIFEEKSHNNFSLTQLSGLLRSDVKNTMRPWVLLCGDDHYKVWGNFLESVKTGESAFIRTHGMNSFEYYSKNPEIGSVFNQAMTSFSIMINEEIVKSYNFSPFKKIVDVGGGVGSLIVSILKAYPKLSGVLHDMATVINEAKEITKKENLGNRLEFDTNDFFKLVPGGGDIYILKLIIHDWDDERSVLILKNCNKAMNKNGRLLVVDKLIPNDGKFHLSLLADLNMMAVTGGRERTEEGFRDLYNKAGFRLINVIPLNTPIRFNMCIFEGVKD